MSKKKKKISPAIFVRTEQAKPEPKVLVFGFSFEFGRILKSNSVFGLSENNRRYPKIYEKPNQI